MNNELLSENENNVEGNPERKRKMEVMKGDSAWQIHGSLKEIVELRGKVVTVRFSDRTVKFVVGAKNWSDGFRATVGLAILTESLASIIKNTDPVMEFEVDHSFLF